LKKLVGVLVVAAFLSLLGLRLYQELSAEETQPGPSRFGGGRSALLVETGVLQSHQFETTLEVLGELEAQAVVEVMSQISGRLSQVSGELGERVEEGQLLAVVDDVDLRQQIRRAEAVISVSRAGVNREQVTYESLLTQVERYRDLHEESLISTQELEDLESRLGVAEAQVELAKAQVEQSEASLRELRIQQEQTRIYSPLDGYISARHLEPGSLVSPSVSILSVLNLDRVKTIVGVSERALHEVQVGLKAQIEVDAFADRTYQGTVTRISPFLNPETRTADVEIGVANLDHALKPGMFARVRIDAGVTRVSPAIPRSALLTRGSEKGVYLLGEGMTTIFQPIETGRITGEVVEVLSGLEAGVEFVTAGAQNVNEGDRVRLQGDDMGGGGGFPGRSGRPPGSGQGPEFKGQGSAGQPVRDQGAPGQGRDQGERPEGQGSRER
jgi:RND family efflux transporter MFP subunit